MKAKTYLFTVSENSFYRRLVDAVHGTDLLVFPKVRLMDLIEWSSVEELEMYKYSVMAKHVDFLLCSSSGFKPVAVLELDDATHWLPEVRESDAVKNWACAACSIPIIRFGGLEQTRPHMIRQRIDTVLKPTLRAVSV